MKEVLIDLLQGIPAELAVAILAMAPIVELRAALPLALLHYEMALPVAFVLVVIANLIPAIAILLFWGAIVTWAEKQIPPLGKIMQKWYQKTQVQWDAKIEKYGPWALIIFVAIPLPGSGAWSGALAAWLFGINKRNSMLAIFVGLCLSAAIVASITIGGIHLFS